WRRSLHRSGTLIIRDCTIADNSTRGGDGASGGGSLGSPGSAEGGGIFNLGDGGLATVQMDNSIVAGSGDHSDFWSTDIHDGIVWTGGASNLVQNNPLNSGFVGSATLTGLDPGLSSLANHGGPTETMMPWPTSPAIAAGFNPAVTVSTDQR